MEKTQAEIRTALISRAARWVALLAHVKLGLRDGRVIDLTIVDRG